MSESAYETNRLRCRAVIRAELGTVRELGIHLLPHQPEHQATVRAHEWLRGTQPRDFDLVMKWIAWTDAKWTPENKEKLEAALAEEITDQKTKGKQ